MYFIERKKLKIKTKYFRAFQQFQLPNKISLKYFSFDFVEFSLIRSVPILNNSNTLGLKSKHYLYAPLLNGASLLVEGFPMVSKSTNKRQHDLGNLCVRNKRNK
jgi:hypothetical protein